MKPVRRLAVCLLLLAATWCLAMAQSQSQPQEAVDDEGKMEPQPLVPPPATAAEKAIRDKIGAFFNGGGGPPLDSEEWPSGMPGPDTIVDFAPGPALPFGEASTVILGRPTNTQPYLSENRRAIYTEVAVQVDEVFKAGSGFKTQKGDVLLLVERGGSVRLANGRVVRQRAGAVGTPLRRGGRYVLFLGSVTTMPRFLVYAAWELRAGRVLATQVHSFSEQKSELLRMDERSFLEAVRAAAR